MKALFVLLLFAGLASGCPAARASAQNELPSENVSQCHDLCRSAGMRLTSIVVVANQTGCVCGNGSSAGSAAAAGGAAVVLMAQQEQQRRQQQRQY